jgi:hypothetical protein
VLVPFVLPVALAWVSTRIEQAAEERAVSRETPAAAG